MTDFVTIDKEQFKKLKKISRREREIEAALFLAVCAAHKLDDKALLQQAKQIVADQDKN